MNCFDIARLNKSFVSGEHRQQVFSELSFCIPSGNMTAIAGSSGSGKSTLLSILSGLEKADSGTVSYQGQSMSHLSDNELSVLRNREFGFVFQSPFYVPYKSVYDNICLPLQYAEQQRLEFQSKVVELMDYVGIAQHSHKLPSRLSGGEQQRMSFARALIMQPKVIFADEPTASLDKINAEKIMMLLREQADRGLTVILVSHDEKTLSYADKVFHIVEQGQQIVASH